MVVDRRRDIFIKLNKISEIVDILNNIKDYEGELKILFNEYDKLNQEENKVFENWNLYLEDTIQKLEHITL